MSSPTLPERIDAVQIALVTPAGIAAIVVAVALSLILWHQQRPRRNPFAAPADVQRWREKNWGRRDA